MSISLKFKHIGSNTTKLLLPIIKNQNILRYLNYTSDEPLELQTYDEKGTVIYQPDLNYKDLQNKKIIFTPFDKTILSELELRLFISPTKGRPNQPISKDMYEIDIICPLKFWLLGGAGEYRSFMIAYEIAKEIDNQYIAGVSTVEIEDWQVFKASESNAGLAIVISVRNGTVI